MMSRQRMSRQLIRLMHYPLPLCVFSFATLDAIIAPTFHLDRLLLGLAGCFQ